ncbi:four-helix bundle copper-binding protein [Streptomyces sp. KM77-8]|uniref:Four-helix bundle copper-binding protein n=1 Tax=Streptomyces haneummycinicus TaxID=3074435 RepID=A0AAT9HJM7_9ACTN
MARGYPRPPGEPVRPAARVFGRRGGGYPRGVTTTSQKELFRFLEDRFACAQACTECARACATRASLVDPDSTENQELVRRKGIMCAEVCDATCRVLSEQNQVDEEIIRVQVEWCRQVCLESAHAFDTHSGAGRTAESCRACARACTEFLATLD